MADKLSLGTIDRIWTKVREDIAEWWDTLTPDQIAKGQKVIWNALHIVADEASESLIQKFKKWAGELLTIKRNKKAE